VDDLIRIETDGDHVGIRLAGDVDMANAAVIGARIDDAVANHATSVGLDLAAVTYFDSAGLRVLSVLATRLKRLQIGLRVHAPVGSVARRVIDLAGVTELVQVADDPA
jgi:anti-anti-sigma factor